MKGQEFSRSKRASIQPGYMLRMAYRVSRWHSIATAVGSFKNASKIYLLLLARSLGSAYMY